MVGNAIGTHSVSAGWIHVMDVSPDTCYGVTLEVDPATFAYDITVWEDGNPANTATETSGHIPGRGVVESEDQNSLDAMEHRHIEHILERTGFNVSQAARLLGIDRATLYNKMRKYGIERQE